MREDQHSAVNGARTLSLADLPPFTLLSDREGQRVAARAVRRDCAPGQMVALEGDPCDNLYVVARGVIRLRHLSLEGREYVLGYLYEGDLLNLVPALDGSETLATADALVETTLFALPCQVFREALAASQAMTQAVAVRLAEETRRLSGMVRDLALYSVRARLARFLLEHAEHEPPHQRWTQASIAANIGTVRDVVGRAVRAFAEEGVIRRERGRLRIVDREALERAAEEA